MKSFCPVCASTVPVPPPGPCWCGAATLSIYRIGKAECVALPPGQRVLESPLTNQRIMRDRQTPD